MYTLYVNLHSVVNMAPMDLNIHGFWYLRRILEPNLHIYLSKYYCSHWTSHFVWRWYFLFLKVIWSDFLFPSPPLEDKLEKPVNGEDKGDSGVDTQNSEGNADEDDPLGPNCYYDKTKSFFDNISCDDNRYWILRYFCSSISKQERLLLPDLLFWLLRSMQKVHLALGPRQPLCCRE